MLPLTLTNTVAKIDAVQAEYSAFETLHETDNLINTAKELGVAYVAYSPLGHGWLVDEFPYKTPDDFAPNDFRRSGKSPANPQPSPQALSLFIKFFLLTFLTSPEIPRREFLRQQSDRLGNQEARCPQRVFPAADRPGMGRRPGHDRHPRHHESRTPGRELGVQRRGTKRGGEARDAKHHRQGEDRWSQVWRGGAEDGWALRSELA